MFDDASLDLAVDGAMAAKFRFGGQVCIAPNRFMVQEGIYEEFLSRMAERIRDLRVGDGLDSRTNLGPLINAAAKEKVRTDLTLGRKGVAPKVLHMNSFCFLLADYSLINNTMCG